MLDCPLKPHWLIAITITNSKFIDEIILNLSPLGYQNLTTLTPDTKFILINSSQMYVWKVKSILAHFTPISDKDFLNINKDIFNRTKRKDKIHEIFGTGTEDY